MSDDDGRDHPGIAPLGPGRRRRWRLPIAVAAVAGAGALLAVAIGTASGRSDGPRSVRVSDASATPATDTPATAAAVTTGAVTTGAVTAAAAPPPITAATTASTTGALVLDDQRLPGAPIAARWRAVAVSTGSEIIVCGGVGAGDVSSDDGAILDLSVGRWRPFEAPSCAGAIDAVWAGGEMFVVRSLGQSFTLSAYRPDTNAWRTILTDGTHRASSMVWSDGLVIDASGDLVVVDPATARRTMLPPHPFEDLGTGGLVADGGRLGVVGLVRHPSRPPTAGSSWFDRGTGTWTPVTDTGQRAYEVAAAVRSGELVIATDGLGDGPAATGGRIIQPELRTLPLRGWIAAYGPRSLAVAGPLLAALAHAAGVAVTVGPSTLVLPSEGMAAVVAAGSSIYVIGRERSHRLQVRTGAAGAVTMQAGDAVIEGERVVSMRAVDGWVEVDTAGGCLRRPLAPTPTSTAAASEGRCG